MLSSCLNTKVGGGKKEISDPENLVSEGSTSSPEEGSPQQCSAPFSVSSISSNSPSVVDFGEVEEDLVSSQKKQIEISL